MNDIKIEKKPIGELIQTINALLGYDVVVRLQYPSGHKQIKKGEVGYSRLYLVLISDKGYRFRLKRKFIVSVEKVI